MIKLNCIKECTEVRFASFFSSGFITATEINPPERKLAKRTSVEWVTLESVLILVATVYKERNCECSFHITAVFELKNTLRTTLPHMGPELKASPCLYRISLTVIYHYFLFTSGWIKLYYKESTLKRAIFQTSGKCIVAPIFCLMS